LPRGDIGSPSGKKGGAVRGWTLLLVLAVIAVLPAVDPDDASAGHFRKCGDQKSRGAGWFDAKAAGVDCRTARQVARQYTWQGVKRPKGFRCDDDRIATEIWRVKCRRTESGHRDLVKFKFGA
jgi:hypothetical protein